MLPQLSMSDNSVDYSVDSEGSVDPEREARIVDEKSKWQQNIQGAIKNLGLLEGTNYNDIHIATKIMYGGRKWAETDKRQIVWFLPLSQDDPNMSAIATLYLYSSRTTEWIYTSNFVSTIAKKSSYGSFWPLPPICLYT